MRIVDFRTFPDGSGPRAALIEAFEGLGLGDGTRTTPIENDTPVAVGYPQDWDDDRVQDAAGELANQVAGLIEADVAVRTILADAEATTETADRLE